MQGRLVLNRWEASGQEGLDPPVWQWLPPTPFYNSPHRQPFKKLTLNYIINAGIQLPGKNGKSRVNISFSFEPPPHLQFYLPPCR